MPRPRLIALDTNVLIDRARDDDVVVDCIETINRRLNDVVFVVLPTVILELADLSNSPSGSGGTLAAEALSNVLRWGFQPMNCIPVGHGIVEETGRKLRMAGLIPEEEKNDSYIVAEAALADATMLISNDSHIRDIDWPRLKLELDRCDVGCPLIASPLRIVSGFFR